VSCRHDVGGRREHIRIPHDAPQTGGVVEHFNGSLKVERLYDSEIASAAILAEEVSAYSAFDDGVWSHHSLGQRIPLPMQRGDQNVFQARSLPDP
jgi:hypothetical protein